MARLKQINLPKKFIDIKDTIISSIQEQVNEITPLDELLVDELIFNLYTMYNAKLDVIENGIKENVIRDKGKKPMYQTNQSLSIYNNSVSNVLKFFKELGISVKDRKNILLKIEDIDFEDNDEL